MLASIDVKIPSSFACVFNDSAISSLEDIPQRSSNRAVCHLSSGQSGGIFSAILQILAMFLASRLLFRLCKKCKLFSATFSENSLS